MIREKHNHLVTSYRLAMGFTAKFVINLGTAEGMTRCSARLIQTTPNMHWHLTNLPFRLLFLHHSIMRTKKVTELRFTPVEAIGKGLFNTMYILHRCTNLKQVGLPT